jgi:hypothetical protein
MAFIMGVNVAYRQVNNLSITLWKESLNSDVQQFYQYKLHKQLPFISNNWTQNDHTNMFETDDHTNMFETDDHTNMFETDAIRV